MSMQLPNSIPISTTPVVPVVTGDVRALQTVNTKGTGTDFLDPDTINRIIHQKTENTAPPSKTGSGQSFSSLIGPLMPFQTGNEATDIDRITGKNINSILNSLYTPTFPVVLENFPYALSVPQFGMEPDATKIQLTTAYFTNQISPIGGFTAVPGAIAGVTGAPTIQVPPLTASTQMNQTAQATTPVTPVTLGTVSNTGAVSTPFTLSSSLSAVPVQTFPNLPSTLSATTTTALSTPGTVVASADQTASTDTVTIPTSIGNVGATAVVLTPTTSATGITGLPGVTTFLPSTTTVTGTTDPLITASGNGLLTSSNASFINQFQALEQEVLKDQSDLDTLRGNFTKLMKKSTKGETAFKKKRVAAVAAQSVIDAKTLELSLKTQALQNYLKTGTTTVTTTTGGTLNGGIVNSAPTVTTQTPSSILSSLGLGNGLPPSGTPGGIQALAGPVGGAQSAGGLGQFGSNLNLPGLNGLLSDPGVNGSLGVAPRQNTSLRTQALAQPKVVTPSAWPTIIGSLGSEVIGSVLGTGYTNGLNGGGLFGNSYGGGLFGNSNSFGGGFGSSLGGGLLGNSFGGGFGNSYSGLNSGFGSSLGGGLLGNSFGGNSILGNSLGGLNSGFGNNSFGGGFNSGFGSSNILRGGVSQFGNTSNINGLVNSLSGLLGNTGGLRLVDQGTDQIDPATGSDPAIASAGLVDTMPAGLVDPQGALVTNPSTPSTTDPGIVDSLLSGLTQGGFNGGDDAGNGFSDQSDSFVNMDTQLVNPDNLLQ